MATDLIVKQGETFSMSVIYNDSNGAPVNMTGYVARMQVRRSCKAATKDLDLTSSPPAGLTITPLAGQTTVTISAAQTAALEAPITYVYDLEIESPGGVVKRLLEGSLTTTPEVTR